MVNYLQDGHRVVRRAGAKEAGARAMGAGAMEVVLAMAEVR